MEFDTGGAASVLACRQESEGWLLAIADDWNDRVDPIERFRYDL